tara:strand:- start:221 stop:379 length:159 start_codon:yes stop_codon:yes gene_type:complete
MNNATPPITDNASQRPKDAKVLSTVIHPANTSKARTNLPKRRRLGNETGAEP